MHLHEVYTGLETDEKNVRSTTAVRLHHVKTLEEKEALGAMLYETHHPGGNAVYDEFLQDEGAVRPGIKQWPCANAHNKILI